ncbi:lysozyme inhibitor LprI family protein [Enterobacter chuandaensis]|uniref:Lysozyme inhibitor LprI family protein n=1 Tax=Enterobacter chuandaensis TaxID=2497875 RepID=A0AA96RSL3_9ENTR|nr:lysozyme inhibitor LprI family protein [Enterobacter chuandaensis]MCW4782715.1 lysozyme inhibitor LprI family protein [Enterobacter chuandaensis]MDA4761543.1 lysozyme inhibitor LprI family protein [Enterobacter chuandaensis]WNS36757.1 lysozyme inhibitor LprI family protein [Enterobacter chuandaensis]
MKNKYIYLTLAALISSSFAKADSPSEWVNYEQIKDAYSKADAELNSVYKKQIQEYKKEGAEFYGQSESLDIYLKKSQLAWIKMRDASCDYETYESKTGVAFSSIYEKCLLDKTNQRIEYLKDYN